MRQALLAERGLARGAFWAKHWHAGIRFAQVVVVDCVHLALGLLELTFNPCGYELRWDAAEQQTAYFDVPFETGANVGKNFEFGGSPRP